MLVLTREDGEAIWVGEAKVIVEQKGKAIRVLVDAPKEIVIVRDEIREEETHVAA